MKYNIYVVVDEAYGDYMPLKNSSINLVDKYNNLIVLKSASKFYGLPNHRIGYLFADKELIKIYNKIALPFAFSDLSASIFIRILTNHKQFLITKEKTIEAKKQICKLLKNENYIYTSLETPILTIKTNKYKNLTKKLMQEGIVAEDCDYFINLDSTFARIRINSDYKKLVMILINIL